MKTKIYLALLAFLSIVFVSCSKDKSEPQISFTNNLAEGFANNQGEFTITGHISSEAQLDKVTLTKQGEASPFLIDESTAKNKNEYDFSYLVTGIMTNTTIVMKIYDQDDQVVTVNFLIKK